MAAKTLGEIKFAISDVLMDTFGLDAQKMVDAVEGATSPEDLRKVMATTVMTHPKIKNSLAIISKLTIAGR